ncbi:MAG: flagellar motor protein MotB [Syntrophales bacterium]|nr:flagellar motor protein MotB [Syntrophales bacterium]
MGKKRKNSEEQGGKWLGTFNDMVTLLLTFFVLILSMSSLDVARVKEASYSFSSAFGMMDRGSVSGVSIFEPFIMPMGDKPLTAEMKKKRVFDQIQGIQAVASEMTEEGITVLVDEELLFRTGMADIEENSPSLDSLGAIIKNADCTIRVEGHTDDVPIQNEQFTSNWELSIARAVNVVNHLVARGGISPERLSASGYADLKSRFPKTTEADRAHNRRVDIVLTFREKDAYPHAAGDAQMSGQTEEG